jgi:hypothetical protein
MGTVSACRLAVLVVTLHGVLIMCSGEEARVHALNELNGDLGEGLQAESLMSQTSDIDKEVDALSKEVAALEKDPASSLHGVAPPVKKKSIVLRSAAPTKPAPKTTAKKAPVKAAAAKPSAAKPKTKTIDAKKQQTDKQALAKKAAEAKEEERVKKLVLTAEKNKEKKEARKEKRDAKRLLKKSEKLSEVAAEEKKIVKPSPVPAAPKVLAHKTVAYVPPAPKYPKDSAAVAKAKAKPMPKVKAFKATPEGVYTINAFRNIDAGRSTRSQKARDLAIANAGGAQQLVGATVVKRNKCPVAKVASKAGAIQTTDGLVKEYTSLTPANTNFCSSYASRYDNRPKWTKTNCSPDWGKYECIMPNLDGVICACGGLKLVNRPPDRAHVGTQRSILVRAQSSKKRIRSYAYKMSSNVDPKNTLPIRGFAWDIEMTDQAAMLTERAVDPKKMRTVFLRYKRIVEYMSGGKSDGLTLGTKKCSDSTGNEKCILQEFYLDNFKPAKVEVVGTLSKFKFETDLQGTSPLCASNKGATCETPQQQQQRKKSLESCIENATRIRNRCLQDSKVKKAADLKNARRTKQACRNDFTNSKKACKKKNTPKRPTLIFSVSADSGKFSHNKMDITIQNFPYKRKDSLLSLESSMYAETVAPTIAKSDETSAQTSTDGQNCNVSPLPKGCPMVNMDDGQVKFSWAKVVADESGNKYKVITTPVQRMRSGTTGTDAKRLLREITYFSFQHGNAKTLIWDPEVKTQSSSLPRDLKSSASRNMGISVVTIAVFSLFTIIAQHFQ